MIQHIRLVVSIPQAVMKWSERPGEVDRERKLVHMLHPFLVSPLLGTLGPSWHWQISINPLQPPLLGVPSGVTRRHGTPKPGLTLVSHLFCTSLAFSHSLTQAHQRVSKVE